MKGDFALNNVDLRLLRRDLVKAKHVRGCGSPNSGGFSRFEAIRIELCTSLFLTS